MRLVIEQLETRQLLAGLNVWVYSDLNGSRTHEVSMDSPAASRLAYLDVDRDGLLDPQEPVSATNREGLAVFNNVQPGTYHVALVNTNQAQVQSFPVSVNGRSQSVNSQSANQIIATTDLARVWLVSDSGLVSVLDASGQVQRTLPLNGTLASVVEPIRNIGWGLVRSNGSSRLVRLDFTQESIEAVQVENLPSGSLLSRVTRIGQQLAIEFERSGERILAITKPSESGVSIDSTFGLAPDAISAGSPAGNIFATAHGLGSTKSSISLVDMSQSNAEPTRIEVDGRVQRLYFTSNGKYLLASVEGRGLLIVDAADGQKLVAELQEASEPVSVNAIDGRIVTGNRARPEEVIVWDARNWQPAGRAVVNGNNSANPSHVQSIAMDRDGRRLLIASSSGTHEVNIAAPVAQQVTVSNESVARVEFGIRSVGSNSAPVATADIKRWVREDSVDQSRSGELVQFVRDADGNALWFTLDAAPRHGQLELTTDGTWRYVPAPDFSGQDSATVRVHDGIASSPATITIEVSGVNDPPRDMSTNLVPIPENSTARTSLGFVTVFDPDRDAQYVFTTSDARFVVENGEIFLSESRTLDYESARTIPLEITAADVTNPDFTITRTTTVSVVDINEPPLGLSIGNNRTVENLRGNIIGPIIVDDPDGGSDLKYTVSDGRFEVVGGVLRLRAGVELDHETESRVTLVVAGGPTEADPPEVSTTITIIVTDQNDPPTGITLSGRDVLSEQTGYVIGQVAVLDQDGTDQYEIYVSDPRFEIVGRTLKVRDDQFISILDGETVFITIYAMAQNGDFVSENFTLAVKQKASAHNNTHNSLDVNNDGQVTAMDALILVNYLNQNGPQVLGPKPDNGEGEPAQFIDVNNDGAISPIDVLIIINHLNNAAAPRSSGEGESPDASAIEKLASSSSIGSVRDEEERPDTAQLDQELDVLLEQLSKERLGRRRG